MSERGWAYTVGAALFILFLYFSVIPRVLGPSVRNAQQLIDQWIEHDTDVAWLQSSTVREAGKRPRAVGVVHVHRPSDFGSTQTTADLNFDHFQYYTLSPPSAIFNTPERRITHTYTGPGTAAFSLMGSKLGPAWYLTEVSIRDKSFGVPGRYRPALAH